MCLLHLSTVSHPALLPHTYLSFFSLCPLLDPKVAEQFTAFLDLTGPTDLGPLRAEYPQLRQFFDVMQEVGSRLLCLEVPL